MFGDRWPRVAAVGVTCGGAFAGGLLAQRVAADKALVGGAVVAAVGLVMAAAAARLALRRGGRTPNQALQPTAGA